MFPMFRVYDFSKYGEKKESLGTNLVKTANVQDID